MSSLKSKPSSGSPRQAATGSSRSVVVLGGGAVGMCVALALQERGFTVTVVDSGPMRQQASWGNIGRIAVELSEPLASLATLRSLPRTLYSFGGPVALPWQSITSWLPFGLRFLAACTPQRFAQGRDALAQLLSQALPAWRRRLAAIDAPEMLIEAGHYSVWETASSSTAGRAAWRAHSGAATTVELSASELTRLRALVKAPIAGTLGFRGTASIADLTDLYVSLRSSFLSRGGTLSNSPLPIVEAERLGGIVVVAAGIGSTSLLEAVGHTVPMIAERGYHIDQADADWPQDLPPILFENRALVVTRFRSGLRASSFTEFSSEHAPPDARKWARLRRHAAELGLPFDSRATEWMGSRPTLPDYLPAIGQSRRRPALLYAFGHQHLGLTLAAISGELIAALVSGDVPPASVERFDIGRFASDSS